MHETPFTFGNYEIEEKLHQGAGGTFFRATQKGNGASASEPFLIYFADVHLKPGDPAFHELLKLLEMSVAGSHPNILATRATLEAVDEFCVVSEWMEGGSLATLHHKRLGAGERWPVPAVLFLALELARALVYLHTYKRPSGQASGRKHGQVRPEHAFLSTQGNVKLLAPSIADLETLALANSEGFRAGAPSYASPEQAAGRAPNERSDQFSLGVVIWELLVGRPLFAPQSRDEWHKALASPSPLPSTVRGDLPEAVDRMVAKLLDRDPDHRYASSQELVAELGESLIREFPGFSAADFARTCQDGFEKPSQRTDEPAEEFTLTAVTTKVERPPAPVKIQMAQPNLMQGGIKFSSAGTGKVRRLKAQSISLTPGARGESFSALTWAKGLLAFSCLALLLSPFWGRTAIDRFRHRGQPRDSVAKVVRPGSLRFHSKEINFSVQVNGHYVDQNDNAIEVPADEALAVLVRKPGYEDLHFERILGAGEEMELELDFRKALQRGSLAIEITPPSDFKVFSGATVVIEGRTPLEETTLLPGKYRVEILNSYINSKEQMEVTVEEGKLTHLNRQLASH